MTRPLNTTERAQLHAMIARTSAQEVAKHLGRPFSAAADLLAAVDEICDLPADDSGERIIPPGFLDKARKASTL